MSDSDSLIEQCQGLLTTGTPPQTFAIRVGERTLVLRLTGWLGDQEQADLAATLDADRARGEAAAGLADILPDPDDLKYFIAALDTTGDDLAGIAPENVMALAGADAEALPGWLAGGDGARLDALAIRVSAVPRLLHFEAAVSMATDRAWQIVPDMIAVRDLRFQLLAEKPFDPAERRLEVGARGTICFGKAADGGPAVALSVEVRAMDEPALRRMAAADDPEALAATLAPTLAATLPQEPGDDGPGDDPAPPGNASEALEAAMLRGLAAVQEAESGLFNRVVVDGRLALDANGRPQEVALSGLLGHFGWGDGTLGADVRIVDARCHYDSDHGQFGLRVSIAGPRVDATSLRRRPALSLFHDTLTLRNASVEISGSAETGQVEGEVRATLSIAEELVMLRASCAASGIVFEGRWEHRPDLLGGYGEEPDADEPGAEESAIDGPALDGWMKARFGTGLDPTLDTIQVQMLDLQLDTAANRLSLELEGSLQLGTFARDAVTAMIRVEIGAEEGGKIAARFEGVLLVAFDDKTVLEFDLDVIREGGSSTLFAAYREHRDAAGDAPPDHKIGLRALARSLGVGDALPEKLEFAIPAAYLARSQGSTAMGFEIAGGLTLGELALPSGLELFRDALDDLSDIAINVDMAYVSGDVLPPLVAERAEAHGFHAADGPGLSLLLHASLGEQRFDFKSIRLDDAGKMQSPRDVPPRSSGTGPEGGGTAPVRDTSGARWIELQRAFGPIRLNRLGVAVDQAADDIHVSALLDGTLEVGGLTVALEGLRVTSPLSTLSPTLSLDGLGIDYSAAGVSLGGALVHTDLGFAGELLVRAQDFSVTVEAIYETIQGHPSMAAYGVLQAPLGGPPCFFVTGLAAGFGYNRRFAKPTPDKVATNPLIRPLLGDGHSGFDARQLAEALPAATGSHFLAFGIAFDSFRMIESFALAILQFGERVELDLLGVSTLDLPVDGKGKPLVHCRLVWTAFYAPAEGLLALDAELSDDSYLFDTDCRPEGGLAFRAWLEETGTPPGGTGPQRGDFVLTIGGYHKEFRVRPHHPLPKPVTLNWKVSRELTIKGSTYFALTGTAAMAGGELEATYDADVSVGHVNATFKASADFLLSWSPLHYDARFHVEVSATFTYSFFGTHHVHFHAAADLHVWGPDFSMRARVSVTVVGYEVAFHVAYHDTPQKAIATRFGDFLTNLLPAQPITVRVVAGAYPGRDPGGIVDLDPHALVLAIETTVPVGEIRLQRHRIFVEDPAEPGRVPNVGARPCGGQDWRSRLHVTVEGLDGLLLRGLERGPVPAALWGRPATRTIAGVTLVEQAGPNDPQSVPNVPLGLQLKTPEGTMPGTASGPEASASDELPREANPPPTRRHRPPATLSQDDRRALRAALQAMADGVPA